MGNFCQRKAPCAASCDSGGGVGEAFARPLDGVGEDDESDQRVAAGFGEDGVLACGVGVEGACGGGFGGVVDCESRPEAVGVVGHVQGMADEGEGEEGDGTEGEDGGDGGGRVLFVCVDGSLGGDDGGDSADAGADCEQGGERGWRVEGAAQPGHEGDGESDGDEDEDEGDPAELEDVSEDEACAEQNDSGLEPELVCGDAGAEDAGETDGVGDESAEEDGPEDVLDIGEGDVVGFGVGVEEVLDELTCVADDGEQRMSGKERGEDVELAVSGLAEG